MTMIFLRRLTLFCLVFGSVALFAGGFQLYSESSTDVLGIGGAAVARSGHASSAWYNPSATTTIEVPTAAFGGTLIKLESGYTSPETRHTEWLDEQCRLTGFFYGVVPIHDDWRLNLSVNAPYGMITQWPHDYSLNTLATFTSLRVCYISPSVAYRLSDELSLGVGMNAAIGVARLASYIDLSQYGQGQNKLYMRADAEGVGGFLSLFYQPWEDWSFGVHYQSKIKLNFKGDAKYRQNSYLGGLLQFRNTDVKTHIDMPAYLAIGVENHSFEKWRFMFDAVWTQWSSYKALDVTFDKYPGTNQKGTLRNPRNWHDVWSFRFGAEYQLTDCWVLRAGYMHDLSPSNSRSTSPEMPDSNKRLFALGVGYQTPRWGFDLSYAYVDFEGGKLGSQVAKSHNLPRGNFDTRCQVLSAAVTLRF